MILARHAEALLWAGRYLERAETTARCLNVAGSSVMHLTPADAQIEWAELIAALGLVEEFEASDAELTLESVRSFLLSDPESPGSVRASVAAVKDNFGAARDRLPIELWEEANRLHLELRALGAAPLTAEEAQSVLVHVRRGCQAMSGVLSDAMLREEGHAFITIGQMLERAILTFELLKAALSSQSNTFDAVRLLRSSSALQAYRRRHGHDDDWIDVTAFLIEDVSVPRSVASAVSRVQGRLDIVDVAGLLAEPRRLAGRLRSRLEYADLQSELGADAFACINELSNAVHELSGSIASCLAPPMAAPVLHAQFVRPGRSVGGEPGGAL